MIEIVSATRLPEEAFWKNAALGISLRRLSYDKRLVSRIAYENQLGLPSLYNMCILGNDSEEILVFLHDDVWIDDYYFVDRILDGLENFDVIGVAGNRRRVLNQPAWAFVDDKFTWDEKSNLSGSVAHGNHPFGAVGFYGNVPSECELLDGVFLAARQSTLRNKGVLFDTLFDFHFYDMDFCRSAREKGLRIGTWPICLTHQSGGSFGSATWAEKCLLYRNKWKT